MQLLRFLVMQHQLTAWWWIAKWRHVGERAGHPSVQGDITIYRYCDVQRAYRNVRGQSLSS